MFYQNNNDYMRDAFYYSSPTATYSNSYNNGVAPLNPMQNNTNQMLPLNPMYSNQFNNGMMNNQMINPNNMYPQVYRIVSPVANRVISNTNYQYLTEDTLDNMVDTVYNIVEGDVATVSTTTQANSDDTITQGNTRNSANSNNNTNVTRQNTENRSSVTTATTQNNRENQLLRDLIKIIIIKEILSRQRNYVADTSMRNNTGNNNFYDPRMYGII